MMRAEVEEEKGQGTSRMTDVALEISRMIAENDMLKELREPHSGEEVEFYLGLKVRILDDGRPHRAETNKSKGRAYNLYIEACSCCRCICTEGVGRKLTLSSDLKTKTEVTFDTGYFGLSGLPRWC